MISDLSVLRFACAAPGPWQDSQTRASFSFLGFSRKAFACSVSLKCSFSYPWQEMQAFSPMYSETGCAPGACARAAPVNSNEHSTATMYAVRANAGVRILLRTLSEPDGRALPACAIKSRQRNRGRIALA